MKERIALWWKQTAWPRIRFEAKDYAEQLKAEPMAHCITFVLSFLVGFLC